MSDLEKFIRNHKKELDAVEEPNVERIWNGIQQKKLRPLDRPLSKTGGWDLSVGRNWQWAIAASILLAVGLFFYPFSDPQQETTNNSIAVYFPELAEQEQEYRQLISDKESSLGLSELDRNAYQEIFMELQMLENIHQEFLADVPRYQKNDQLVETLLKYYERKIRILERLSKEIEKNKNDEKSRQEKML